MFTIAALYQFRHVGEPPLLRSQLLRFCQRYELLGTLLVANEGINGTLAGSAAAIAALKTHLQTELGFDELQWKQAGSEKQPFLRLKVKLKREIVTMGVPDIDPNRLVGTYVDPADWNSLINDPAVTVIDTRNRYEYHLGTFDGAIDPGTDSFRDFPNYASEQLDPTKHQKVAMFCTGGIRCEKATAYLKAQGFAEVFHLRGGILRYLEEIPPAQSLWHGECFVFDDRVTVDHDLNPSAREVCPNCRMPIREGDKQVPEYEPNVSCKHCHDRVTEERRASLLERNKQAELANQRRRRSSSAG